MTVIAEQLVKRARFKKLEEVINNKNICCCQQSIDRYAETEQCEFEIYPFMTRQANLICSYCSTKVNVTVIKLKSEIKEMPGYNEVLAEGIDIDEGDC